MPARIGSTRLPRKALALFGGRPLIVRAWEIAIAAGVGPVIVATDSPEIATVIEAEGGRAELSVREHVCGTDRVAELVSMIDPSGRYDPVVNMQGDIALLPDSAIDEALSLLEDNLVDIGTVAAPLPPERANDSNVVKIVATEISPKRLRALYFTRAAAPWGDGPRLGHIGIYAFRRATLEAFAARPPSPLERRERLEQLRALEAGWRIDVALLDKPAASVDTGSDLEARVAASVRREEK